MKKPHVRYLYALNDNNELIEIHTAHELGGVFHCPECGEKMICKCGTKKAWHFAHEKVECDYNHYLHTVAEQRIMEWFNRSNDIPLILQRDEKCEESTKCKCYYYEFCRKTVDSEPFNLKRYYSHCDREIRFEKERQNYIADILCYPKNERHEPLFIEICVTHPCEEKKLESGIKIIEFVIQSEYDLDEIIGKQIRLGEKTKLYNFHPKEKTSSNRVFERRFEKFVLFSSKKGFVDKIQCSRLNERRGILEITIPYNEYVPEFMGEGGFFSIAYAVAFQYDSSIKHCCLCKYHTYDDWDGIGICRLFKKYGTNREAILNDAQKCTYFRIDKASVESRKKEFDSYCSQNPVDIWHK